EQVIPARAHCEQGFASSARQSDRPSVSASGAVDQRIFNLDVLALLLWYLGYPDQAHIRVQEALNLSRQLAHPPSLEQALAYAGILYQLRREPSHTRAYAEEALAISRARALNRIFLGWANAARGDGHEGAALIVQGIAAYRANGADAWRDHYLGLLAEAHAMASHIKEAFDAVAEGLAIVQVRGGGYYTAELHRIRGELLLTRLEPLEAERSF